MLKTTMPASRWGLSICLVLLLALPAAASDGPPAPRPAADNTAAQDCETVELPRTQAQWRERIESLTPGMTPQQVADAIGREPDTLRKSPQGHIRMDYYYYIGNIKQRQWLILHFSDGVYTDAQW